MTKICSVPECSAVHYARGYCSRHYRLFLVYGVPYSLSDRYTRTAEERFWQLVDKNGPIHPVLKTRCWIWIGSRLDDGYGQFNLDGQTVRAHRYSFFLAHGKWPTLDVLHHCDNPSCVRSDHFYEGTDKDNAQDRDTRRRRKAPKGEANGRAILTRPKIQELKNRFSHGETIVTFIQETGLNRSTISRALNGRSWK